MTDNALAVRSEYDELVDFTLTTVSESSKRLYRFVFDKWRGWCNEHGKQPLDLKPVNVLPFLESLHVTMKTRKRHLSAMRKLARVYAISRPEYYAALKLVYAPEGNLSDVERDRRALSPTEVHKVLSQWNGATALDKRNRAMIALLFLTGMRRSELAALKWSDLDLDNYTVSVRHGKGDKERDVAIAGELAKQALLDWQECIKGRTYVFPPFDHKQELGEDVPTDGQTVYRVVKRTEKLSGVKFAPHTARRTFITEGLITGTPLASMQAQAGHSRGETTLGYARPVDAIQRRREFRHRYGD